MSNLLFRHKTSWLH